VAQGVGPEFKPQYHNNEKKDSLKHFRRCYAHGSKPLQKKPVNPQYQT
jgi:hypothetical protein